jgi:hypothetical protein
MAEGGLVIPTMFMRRKRARACWTRPNTLSAWIRTRNSERDEAGLGWEELVIPFNALNAR